MTPEQVSQIFKSLPKGTTDYTEIRIYLKGRQHQIHSISDKAILHMSLRNNLLILNSDSTDAALLKVSYTQFIDVNEIQSINFI